jgi:nitroreductase
MNAHALTSRIADHAIDPIFVNRHSPRAFAEATLTEADLLALLEAARWAPSASNNQPWRFAYGLRGDDGFARIAETLVPFNRTWAEKAAALVVVGSIPTVEKDGVANPNPWHAFDAGAAWMSLALQAHLKGLFAHAMGGFDKAKATELLNVPQDYALHAIVAIGSQGPADSLPEGLRAREVHSPRRPLAEVAKHGSF